MCNLRQRVLSRALLLSLLAASVASAADPSLVGWWKLDETSGTTAVDSSGKGSNGELHGAGTWVAGHLGGAWQGTTTTGANAAYIAIPHNESLNLSNAVTVALWVYIPVYATAQIIEKGGTGGNAWYTSYGFRTESNGTLRIQWGNTNWNPAASVIPLATWTHVAMTFDLNAAGNNNKLYLNGALAAERTWTTALTTGTDPITLAVDRYNNNPRYIYRGMLDDLRIYNEALPANKIAVVMAGGGLNTGAAADPVPADKATDVVREPILGWTAGEFAGTHDVYLGTTFADVNTASRTSPQGVLVSQGQADTAFDAGSLPFGQTYFWRVDEVNAPPDSTIFKGEVWSFATEPYSYPIPALEITATASSQAPDSGPQKTSDGSGLNPDGQHSTDATTMWSSTGVLPNWILYEFDKVFVLDKLRVWNSNLSLESVLGMGAKEVTIEYSADGTTWTPLGAAKEFARAPGSATYTANTTVDFGRVMAKYVKLTINSTWSGSPVAGLGEVQFLYVPVRPWEPQPASGAADVPVQTALSWRAGREAASHQVFFGTDPNQLALAATVQKPTYQADLDLGQTYYWKIVEVNQAKDPATWTGDLWSFATQQFLVVEDFESYTDDEGKAIWQTWADGLENPANGGSLVGNDPPPYAEQTIIHAGKQAMPLFYDNTAGAAYSEAKRTFDKPQNWAQHGIQSLTFYFLGQAGNTGRLYVKINNTRVDYPGEAADLARIDWQPFVINLSKVTGGLQSVTSLTIGVEGAGTKGKLYLDDIRLYPKAAEVVTPADPGNANLVGWWNFDAGAGTVAADSSGKGHNGTITSATWDTGKLGGALSFNGMGAYVEVPAAAWSPISQQATVSVWLYVDSTVTQQPFTFAAFRDPAVGASRVFSSHVVYNNGNLYFDSGGDGVGYDRINKAPAKYEYGDAWTHWAFVKNAQTGEQKIYRNGILWHSGTGMTRTMTGVTVFTLGAHPNKTANFWTGVMDDFCLYDRALSAEEILWLAGKTAPVAQGF